MSYTLYRFAVSPEWAEILIAWLGELPFEAFEETETGVNAWAPAHVAGAGLDTAVEELRSRFDFSFEKEAVPDQNWNEVWESNFQPVLVDDFCGVRAEFHEPLTGVQYELVIQPRMAFGTGHHATTEMMMRSMRELSFQGLRVLDYGCGTGILAILAAKLGAGRIDAVDIEEESYANTLQNAALNGAPHIRAFCGTLDAVPPGQYDVLLANINRNVLLDTMQSMREYLAPNGTLLISGILLQDVPAIIQASEEQGLAAVRRIQKGDWACLTLRSSE